MGDAHTDWEKREGRLDTRNREADRDLNLDGLPSLQAIVEKDGKRWWALKRAREELSQLVEREREDAVRWARGSVTDDAYVRGYNLGLSDGETDPGKGLGAGGIDFVEIMNFQHRFGPNFLMASAPALPLNGLLPKRHPRAGYPLRQVLDYFFFFFSFLTLRPWRASWL